MKSGFKLWQRAKKIIPSGNMLFSKRPEQILPVIWPTYYSKSKGCDVWDLDNNKYIDLFFGVGTNILGYANQEIDYEVKKAIDNSNMSSLNCPEEVYLAEKLIELHPSQDMVRFARTGGEANSIAVRIARAASGKDCIAVCGYHGWHDWYLAANLQDPNNLNNHLLSGLDAKGVPKCLKDSVRIFDYNNFDQLSEIINNNELAAVKMEVSKNLDPKNNFLSKVRQICNEKNIILIFDECTSGFRQTFGGLHKYYEIYPDMCMFGKALGNGYAITAVLGKKSIMEHAQKTFISSTFWTERIGSVAALKTLDIMERTSSWEVITETGNNIKNKWLEISQSLDIKLQIDGIPALPSFKFVDDKDNILITYFCQEMLKKGYLTSNIVFVSIVHTHEILKKYFEALYEVFFEISKHPKDKILKQIENYTRKSSFERSN